MSLNDSPPALGRYGAAQGEISIQPPLTKLCGERRDDLVSGRPCHGLRGTRHSSRCHLLRTRSPRRPFPLSPGDAAGASNRRLFREEGSSTRKFDLPPWLVAGAFDPKKERKTGRKPFPFPHTSRLIWLLAPPASSGEGMGKRSGSPALDA